MEKYIIICMRDRKAGVYSAPKTELNEAIAIRTFLNNCKKCENQDFAQDLELYQIGVFDCVSGVVEPFDKPKFLTGYEG